MGRKLDRIIRVSDGLVDLSRQPKRGLLYEIHIADLHFASIDPKVEYDILTDQFTNKISPLPRIDIISVNGDIFDHKLMSNSDSVFYAMKFIDDLVQIARSHNATLVLIDGTPSHDAGQLKLFYHYLEDDTVDVRIVTSIQFQWIKGAKILCVPEMHGYPEADYRKYLYYDWCDQVFGHMTIDGSVYGNNVGTGRLFSIEDFLRCRGPILSGHVHVPGIFYHDFYYSGSPIRYKFGEEQAKGFLVCIMDLDTRQYYVDFEEITSFKYTTIDLVDIMEDPKAIIDYITKIQNDQKIDHIKIKFKYVVDGANRTVITNYYRNRGDVKLEFYDNQQEVLEKLEQEQKERDDTYAFLSDHSMTDEEKFCRYVNIQEGYDFITVDKLREILTEEI